MAKRASVEEKLAAIRRLAPGPLSADGIAELSRVLSGKNSILVEQAARVAAETKCLALVPDLAAAFDRFMVNPDKTDKGARAKTGIIKALNALDYDDPGPYLRGVRHVQKEPAFGGPVDTAAQLRIQSALGLARIGHGEVFFALTGLLFDPEAEARRAAARILASFDRDESEILLRARILAGDREPAVLGDCFAALMDMAPARSIAFVAGYVEAPDRIVSEEAALALGNSRTPEAFERLREIRETSIDSGFKAMLLVPMALTRCEGAFAYLLAVLAEESAANAGAAAAALRLSFGDARRLASIRKAVETRNDPAVTQAFEKA